MAGSSECKLCNKTMQQSVFSERREHVSQESEKIMRGIEIPDLLRFYGDNPCILTDGGLNEGRVTRLYAHMPIISTSEEESERRLSGG
jgi:hypothetical protein